MKFNFYNSTCSAVLALVLFFAFGFADRQSKTVQAGYPIITVGNTEVIALFDATVAISANELLTAKTPGSTTLLPDQPYLKDPVEVSIAKENYLIAGDYISFPGIGRVRKAHDAFVWIPAP
ncbi:MAG: hypothetical protein K2Y30_02910 [Flavobacteriaceae bacterium]|nr:hypothetical protein [Flavobacteriaceae bacterium]